VPFPGVALISRKRKSAKRKFSIKIGSNLTSPPMGTPIRENMIEERKESRLSSQEQSSSQRLQFPTPSVSKSITPSNVSMRDIEIAQKSRKTFKSEEEKKLPSNQR